MRAKRGEIQVFSMSFLDVLSCALGGTLLLLVLVQQDSRDKVKKAEDAKQQAEQDAEQAKQEAAEAKEQAEKMQAFTGLGGDLENIVYVFDTSGSMSEDGSGDRIPDYYLTAFCDKVRTVPADAFNLISFATDATAWRPNTMPAKTDTNVEAGCEFIEDFRADGMTNSIAALRLAYSMPGVDTIIFFTDGDPTVDSAGKAEGDDPAHTEHCKQECLDFVRQQGKEIAINTVSIGDNVDTRFLAELASEGGGGNMSL